MKTRKLASLANSVAICAALSAVVAFPSAHANPIGPERPIAAARELMTLKIIARECSLGAELDQTISLLAGSTWARLHTITDSAVVARTREGVEDDVSRRLAAGQSVACAGAREAIVGYSSDA
ncbi:MAG: hypothetical protein RIS35_581 [Pseudomonadota bacterium]